MPPPWLRPLQSDEGEILAAIRLESLAECPDAFAESRAAAIAAAGGEHFSAELSEGAIWGAFLYSDCVAMAGLDRWNGAHVAHRATLWGVYVRPSSRGSGSGVGGDLLTAMFRLGARTWRRTDRSGVGETNKPALALYQRLGFEPYAVGRQAMKLPERHIDEVAMKCRLRRVPPRLRTH